MRVAAIILLIIGVGIAAYFVYRAVQQDQIAKAEAAHQISDLNARIGKLQSDNDLLHNQLAKVQEENYSLKGYNDVLLQALQTAKATGKVPIIKPYPPK